jgi:protein-disulfide isomerase
VFRNYPQTKEHPHAISAALAAESVGRGGEDAFWSMHDRLYENQDALQDDDLVEYGSLRCRSIAVADDLSTGATASRVSATFAAAVAAAFDTRRHSS